MKFKLVEDINSDCKYIVTYLHGTDIDSTSKVEMTASKLLTEPELLSKASELYSVPVERIKSITTDASDAQIAKDLADKAIMLRFALALDTTVSTEGVVKGAGLTIQKIEDKFHIEHIDRKGRPQNKTCHTVSEVLRFINKHLEDQATRNEERP